MILTSDLLPTDVIQTTSQLPENEGISDDSTTPDSTFAEILRVPSQSSNPDLTPDSGEDLPPSGEGLPEESDLAIQPQESLPETVPVNPGAQSGLPGLSDDELAPAETSDTASLVADESIVAAVVSPALLLSDAATDRRKNSGRMAGAGTEERMPGLLPARSPLSRPIMSVEGTQISTATIGTADTNVVGGDRLDVVQRLSQLNSEQVQLPPPEKVPVLDAQVQTQVAAVVAVEQSAPIEVPTISQQPATVPGSAQVAATILDTSQLQPVASTESRTSSYITAITQPLTDDKWGDALQNRVLWMTGQNIQRAEIRLNPSELGPIRVHVAVEGDSAQLTFTAQQLVTREAIEQAIPRLREMLAENGLSVAGFSVNSATDTDVRHDDRSREPEPPSLGDEGPGEDPDVHPVPVRKRSSVSLVDTFA